MEKSDFEALVLEVLEAIPEEIRRKMDNVEILVQDRSDESIRLKGKRRSPILNFLSRPRDHERPYTRRFGVDKGLSRHKYLLDLFGGRNQ